jgi:hypothetical protein
MTPDEREQIHILCQRIAVEAVEKDREKFTQLVDQLNELLEQKRNTWYKTAEIESPKSTPADSLAFKQLVRTDCQWDQPSENDRGTTIFRSLAPLVKTRSFAITTAKLHARSN